MECGQVVESGDVPGLVQALDRFCDPSYRRTASRRAHAAAVATLSLTAMRSALERTYRDALGYSGSDV